MEERGYKRRRYYIHEIQKKHILLTIIFLLAYTFILILFLFVPPAVKLFTDAPLTEKVEAAAQVLVFAERLWPAVIISLILSGLVSVYVTYHAAGPIYRFEQTMKRLMEGDLAVRIKLRKGDSFVYLSNLINQMAENIDGAITDVKKETLEIKKMLEAMESELKSKGGRDTLAYVEDIEKHRKEIEKVLARFKTSSLTDRQIS